VRRRKGVQPFRFPIGSLLNFFATVKIIEEAKILTDDNGATAAEWESGKKTQDKN
jgi:hypothetical protein